MGFNHAVYSMDQVSPLPPTVAKQIHLLFYPSLPPSSESAPDPTLCRLYFGKVIQEVNTQGRPTRFFNSSNFPLDVARYSRLVVALKHVEFPTAEILAKGMGEMVGRLHWHAGFDARDVEFVLGGLGFSDVAPYVIDFNQMRPWSRDITGINLLVESFFNNDPYFPRPRISDPLWPSFCEGYMAAYPGDKEGLALAVIQALQDEQGRRDTQRMTHSASLPQ